MAFGNLRVPGKHRGPHGDGPVPGGAHVLEGDVRAVLFVLAQPAQPDGLVESLSGGKTRVGEAGAALGHPGGGADRDPDPGGVRSLKGHPQGSDALAVFRDGGAPLPEELDGIGNDQLLPGFQVVADGPAASSRVGRVGVVEDGPLPAPVSDGQLGGEEGLALAGGVEDDGDEGEVGGVDLGQGFDRDLDGLVGQASAAVCGRHGQEGRSGRPGLDRHRAAGDAGRDDLGIGGAGPVGEGIAVGIAEVAGQVHSPDGSVLGERVGRDRALGLGGRLLSVPRDEGGDLGPSAGDVGPVSGDPALVSGVQGEHVAGGDLAGSEQVDEAGVEDSLGTDGGPHPVVPGVFSDDLIDGNDLLVSGVASLFVRIVVVLQVPHDEHVGDFLGVGQSHGVEVEPGETFLGTASVESEATVTVIDPKVAAHDRTGDDL